MENELIKEVLNTELWKLIGYSSNTPNEFCLNSHMKGFTSGRYRMEIKKLKRKVEGKTYKLAIYWTPYDPDNRVYKGYINNYTELVGVLKLVNKDLLDIKRTYK